MEVHDNIFQAIQACWQGKANSEQIEQLKKWLDESSENMEYFRQISRNHYRLTHSNVWNQVNSQERKSELNALLKNKRKRHIGRYLGIVAAAVLVFFISTRLVFISEIPQQDNIMDLAQIRGGNTNATLIFANGQKVQLHKDSTFELEMTNAIVKGNNSNGLQYQIKDSTLNNQDEIKNVEYNTLVVSRGGEYILTLSDGTKVWLNSETELKYPVRFTGMTREVRVKGEAYFEVKHDSLHPFIVHTPYSQTKVLGTSFNVCAYEDEDTTAITLVKGKVEVSHRQEKCILEPGWQATMDNQTISLEAREVEVESYVSWKDGMFEFKETTLEQLVSQLSRWYDVDFFFANNSVRNIKYTGVIKRDNTLLFMLDFFEKTSNIYFKVDGKVIHIYEK